MGTLDNVTRDLDTQMSLVNAVIHYATVAKKDFVKAAKLMNKDAESKAKMKSNARLRKRQRNQRKRPLTKTTRMGMRCLVSARITLPMDIM